MFLFVTCMGVVLNPPLKNIEKYSGATWKTYFKGIEYKAVTVEF